MKFRNLIPLCALASMLALAASAGESDEAQPQSAEAAQKAQPATQSVGQTDAKAEAVDAPPPPERKLEYRPPSVGKPARSVGGGSRGVHDRVPVVYVLVPDHVGQTTSAQPSLFWFIDRLPGGSAHFEFTLLAEDEEEPVFETRLEAPKQVGIHRIRLADLGVTLEPDTEYEWSVAVVLDPTDPSKDVVATGWIDRVERPQLQSRLAGAGQDAAVYVLAEEGLWYDALTSLGDDIDRAPADPKLRAMQQTLLQQVGLGALIKRPM